MRFGLCFLGCFGGSTKTRCSLCGCARAKCPSLSRLGAVGSSLRAETLAGRSRPDLSLRGPPPTVSAGPAGLGHSKNYNRRSASGAALKIAQRVNAGSPFKIKMSFTFARNARALAPKVSSARGRNSRRPSRRPRIRRGAWHHRAGRARNRRGDQKFLSGAVESEQGS